MEWEPIGGDSALRWELGGAQDGGWAGLGWAAGCLAASRCDGSVTRSAQGPSARNMPKRRRLRGRHNAAETDDYDDDLIIIPYGVRSSWSSVSCILILGPPDDEWRTGMLAWAGLGGEQRRCTAPFRRGSGGASSRRCCDSRPRSHLPSRIFPSCASPISHLVVVVILPSFPSPISHLLAAPSWLLYCSSRTSHPAAHQA